MRIEMWSDIICPICGMTNALVGAMERAWDETHPAPKLTTVAEGDQCAPDGACAI